MAEGLSKVVALPAMVVILAMLVAAETLLAAVRSLVVVSGELMASDHFAKPSCQPRNWLGLFGLHSRLGPNGLSQNGYGGKTVTFYLGGAGRPVF